MPDRPLRLLVAVVMLAATGCQYKNRQIRRQFGGESIITGATPANQSIPWTDLNRRMAEIEQAPIVSQNGATKEELRDGLVHELLNYADYQFEQFKVQAFAGNAIWNSGMDIASIGLSAAATIVGGPAAQALSATDTGLKAVQAKVSDRFLQSQTVVVLITTMESRRTRTRTLIIEGLKKGYDEFGIREAIGLVLRYNNQANLVDAMASIQSTMGSQRATNEAIELQALGQ